MNFLKVYKKQIIVTVASVVVGFIIGIVILLTDLNVSSILTSSDKVIIDFINGKFNYFSLFYYRLKLMLFIVLILILLNLSFYTSGLSFVFVCYQACLFILSVGSVVSMFGLVGFFICLLFVIPVNLVVLFVLILINSVLFRRVTVAHYFKLNLRTSLNNEKFLRDFFIVFILLLLIIFFTSFIFPLFFKSFVFIVY